MITKVKNVLLPLNCLLILFITSCDNRGTPEVANVDQETSQATGATYGVIAETESGKLLGLNEDGINIFKGIPYAQAERWEMPVKPKSWAGHLTAVYAGPVSPRPADSGEYLSNPAYYRVDTSEKDLLNLNVWSPDMTPESPRPVIFWLHGGGYTGGSSIELLEYDGKNLASFGDVVFVSVNHRLNYLGYLDLSAYGEEYKYSGNAGHADIVMALEWVRDNIATFGGDPNNVTIIGQSGGSAKVNQLMAMPVADGLFHKAVAQSTGRFEFTTTQAMAREKTAALVKHLELNDSSNEEIIAHLKRLPYPELAAAAAAVGLRSGTVMDNDYVLPDISRSAGKIPLMVGSVMGEFMSNIQGIQGSYRNNSILQDESVYYTQNRQFVSNEQVVERYREKYGDKADAVMTAFKQAYPVHDLFDGLYTWTFRNNHVASAFTESGGTAYQYVMAYNLPLFNGIVSWHTGGDIAFFFRNLDSIHSWIAGDEKMADKVSTEVATALINFAYTGNPAQNGLAWPAFSVENGETMIFDRSSEVRNYHDREWLKLVEQPGVNPFGAPPPPQ